MNNFNLDCYLVMVAARQASLSSDNSYYTVTFDEIIIIDSDITFSSCFQMQG